MEMPLNFHTDFVLPYITYQRLITKSLNLFSVCREKTSHLRGHVSVEVVGFQLESLKTDKCAFVARKRISSFQFLTFVRLLRRTFTTVGMPTFLLANRSSISQHFEIMDDRCATN